MFLPGVKLVATLSHQLQLSCVIAVLMAKVCLISDLTHRSCHIGVKSPKLQLNSKLMHVLVYSVAQYGRLLRTGRALFVSVNVYF